ncbi:MAG: FHA domain-containing protein [Pseudomonadales bacterium]|nr:FHA domain-containing protein [Pseudomonadales bacterium]
MDSRETSKLVLHWHDRRVVAAGSGCTSLGTSARSDLTVPGEYASREHAHIECRKQYFVFVDHSTNGSYIQTEDEQVTFVRRGEFKLWGNGWIALGERLNLETAVRFQHT